MKSKLIALILISLILTPTTAYAKSEKRDSKGKSVIQTKTVETSDSSQEDSNTDNSKDDNTNKKAEDTSNNTEDYKDKEDKNQENKTAINNFKEQLKNKHEIMRTNRQKNIQLKQKINAKKEELASILSDIQSGKKTLSQNQLDILIAKAKTVKSIVDDIKTLPNLNSDIESTQKDINGQKFEAALSALNNVINKQEARYAVLIKLDADMDELLAIARQAQSTATDSQTSANPTVSTTSTQ